MQRAASKLSESRRYWKGLVTLTFVLVLIAWLLYTPSGLLGKADAVGYAVCHRIDLRSFHIGDIQLPLCARCSGMYLGAMLGLIFQMITGRRRIRMPSWQILVLTSGFVLLFIVDGMNSFFNLITERPGLYQPNNSLRLFTGTGMGLAISVVLFPAFNATIWSKVDPRPAFLNLRSFLILVLIGIGLDTLILFEKPVILYPLAFISAAGVLVLLTLVYSMVITMIIKAENGFTHTRELVFALMGGLTLALIQIGILDVVRFYFTGTWEGFHI